LFSPRVFFLREIDVPGRVRRRRYRRPLPSEPDGRHFDASGSSMKQRTAKHAVNRIGLEGHLHVTRTEPAPDRSRWWQPHQQGLLQSRRHFCCAAQSRLAVLSRASTPEGSLPACAEGNVARKLNPYPADYRSAFASSLLLYPLPCQVTLRFPLLAGASRATGLPRSAGGTYRVV